MLHKVQEKCLEHVGIPFSIVYKITSREVKQHRQSVFTIPDSRVCLFSLTNSFQNYSLVIKTESQTPE